MKKFLMAVGVLAILGAAVALRCDDTPQSIYGTVTVLDVNGYGIQSSTSVPAGTERGMFVRPLTGQTQNVSFNGVAQPVTGSFTTTPAAGSTQTVTFNGVAQAVTVSGTPSVSITGTPSVAQSGTWTATPPAITKGTQGATGFTVQDLKDAGRSMIIFSAAGATPASSEALLTLTKNVDGSTSSVTTYTITSGKTLHLQGVYVQYTQTGTTATRVQVRLRLNTAGACTATSGILLPVELGDVAATAANLTGTSETSLPFPDGVEISGNGTKAICASAVASSAAGTLTLSVVGYEY